MMFSQESCQAIIEMGNVELVECRTHRVYTTYLREQIFVHVGNT